MAQLTEQHLEKYAKQVVEDFFTNNIPMTDGVVKIAEQSNLNPEQIKRLVGAVNNMAFQRKFMEAAGPDRMEASEFHTANPDEAIQRLIGAAKDVMNTMAPVCPTEPTNDLISDLPTTRPEVAPLNMASPEDNLNKVSEPQIKGHIVIMNLRKTAELLEEQKYQKRIELTETLQKLATTFTRSNGPSFEAFEKDAFYKWGEQAAPYLQLLRASLRKDLAYYNHDNMRKIARVIDSSTPEMQLLTNMMHCSNDIETLQRSVDRTNQYLKSLE
ncbi:MAG: hypothetical protein PVI90_00305 [Desulfobacteraceae bacterium]|jgi:hypothetical protein